jgi:hypothetical protein
MRRDPRCALNAHNQQKDRSHERLGRQARKSVQGSAFVDTNLDEEWITSGLPVSRAQSETERLSRSQCICLVALFLCIEDPLNANVAFQAESSECLLVDEKLMTRPQKDSAIGSVPAKQAQGRSATLSFLATIRQDVRFAARQLSKSPGFAFTAILVFGLGIAASTAIFAFVDAAFVKPLPYREPSQLVALFERIPVGDRYHISYGDYLDWKRGNRSFTAFDVYRPERLTLRTHFGADEVSVARVSDGFFGTLGVVPFLGRNFRPGEDQASAPQTVILSYETWQKRFASNRNVLGQAVTLDGNPSLIIGVLPSGFHFAPVGTASFWIALHWSGDLDPRTAHPYYGVARLKPGVSIATACGSDIDCAADCGGVSRVQP